MNESHYEPQAYQTGPTTPPKNHGGIIAFFLSMVIFICGILSFLSVLKIPVFQLTETEDPDISSLSQVDAETSLCRLQDAKQDIQGKTLSSLCRNYYGLPGGAYVTHVSQNSDFYRHGLRSGDILLTLNDMPVADFEEFEEKLADADRPLRITYYRQGKQHKTTIENTEGVPWK
ncbi:MAG: PDZ domain-containing protein [Oscillospiraceae bacterium]|nr:PDZ domain-containing protein [Oscillospiraceae bacterium]